MTRNPPVLLLLSSLCALFLVPPVLAVARPTGEPADGPSSPTVERSRNGTPGLWQGEKPPVTRTNRLIVKLRPGADPALRTELGSGITWSPVFEKSLSKNRTAAPDSRLDHLAASHGLDRVFRLDLPSEAAGADRLRRLAAHPDVEYVEPVVRFTLQAEVNDPFFLSRGSWGQSEGDLWGLHRMDVPTAWDGFTGAGVLVAVIDSGCDFTHPDLAANLFTFADEVAGNGVDDDGNGFVDDVRGWDFADLDNDPTDDNGHGTHVAGTVAAVGDNGIGVVGVAPEARVLCVRGFDVYGLGESDRLAEALLYAADAGARVVNMSWRSPARSQLLEDALTVLHGAGVVPVAAAGNDYGATRNAYPASSRRVITVGASDPLDQRTDFSNSGIGTDVVAPGGRSFVNGSDGHNNVLSLLASDISPDGIDSFGLLVGNAYLRLRGTSMAAPHVSGLVALLLEQRPAADTETLRQVLRLAAAPAGAPGWLEDTAYGRVDAAASLATADAGTTRIWTPIPSPSTELEVTIQATVDRPALQSWTLEYSLEPSAPGSPWTAITSGAGPLDEDAPILWATDDVPDGIYQIRLRSVVAGGLELEDRTRLELDRVAVASPTALQPVRLGNVISIVGNAAGGGFNGYRVEVREVGATAWNSDGIRLVADGAQTVYGGLLAEWDTSSITESTYFDLRLVVDRGSLGPVEETVRVSVDPTLRDGWPVELGVVNQVNAFRLAITDQLVTADVDGDGKADLPVAYDQLMHVFDGDGKPLPGWPQSVEDVSRASIQTSPVVADLDGDGDMEIAVGAGSNHVFIWHHDGRRVDGWPRLFYGRDLAAADLDGDGRHELISANFVSGLVRVFNIDGEFLPGWPRLLPSGEVWAPAVGDIDGDGSPELVFHGRDDTVGQIYVLSAQGADLPGWPVTVPDDLQANDSFPALADVNGDGRLNVVVVDSDCRIRVFDGAGQELPGWPRVLSSDIYRCNSVTTADLTGDGRAEIVLGGSELLPGAGSVGPSILGVFGADGELLPGWPKRIPYPDQIAGFYGFGTAALTDVDGDGRLDILVDRTTAEAAPTALEAFRVDGSRIEGFPKPTRSGADWSSNTPAVADLDGDGLKEAAYIDASGSVYLWDLTAGDRPAADWPMYRRDPSKQGTLPVEPPTLECVPGERVHCLLAGRFQVEATWRTGGGESGPAITASATDETGIFWFFSPNNLELVVKVIDGRSFNGYFWVFYGSLTDVGFVLRITDTVTGAVRVYENAPGTFAGQGDTRAF